jgi:AcrR family transcriptional regulator
MKGEVAESTQTLPRGRHGLSRDEVVGSQRSRMLRSMAEAMYEHGYVGTPVAEIIKRAGVSRETFYQQFSSKQDCFIAALNRAISDMTDHMGPALLGSGTTAEKVSSSIARYLDYVAGDPVTARMFLIESFAAGPEVAKRRAVLLKRFMDALADFIGATTAQARFDCEAFISSIVAMVTMRVASGDIEEIRTLHLPLANLVNQVIERARPESSETS